MKQQCMEDMGHDPKNSTEDMGHDPKNKKYEMDQDHQNVKKWQHWPTNKKPNWTKKERGENSENK